MLSGETSTAKSETILPMTATPASSRGIAVETPRLRVVTLPKKKLDATFRATRIAPFGYDTQKRAFDIAVAGLLLATLAPIILFVAALVRMTSNGPVIFRQKRLTKDGKIFTMYKFRTMRVDAESGSGAVWATNRDPRVTPIGAFLRRTRLDELPQLMNVISGDMSMIGPRPERPEFTKELSELLPNFHRRLEVKGGITGLAQVSSGYAACIESYRKKLAFDLLYVKKRSMLLDLRIAVKTVTVILTGTGAR